MQILCIASAMSATACMKIRCLYRCTCYTLIAAPEESTRQRIPGKYTANRYTLLHYSVEAIANFDIGKRRATEVFIILI